MIHVKQPLQTRLKLTFTSADVDVSTDVLPDLLSFSYNDNESGEADDISLSLKDNTGKWANTWKPDAGEIVKAEIIQGRTDGEERNLYCGKFYVDSLSAAGNPRTLELKAVSTPLTTPIRRKAKSRSFENFSLKYIASKIAHENGLKFIYDTSSTVGYDRVEQKQESDLTFLKRLCDDIGLSLKITDDNLVVFEQSKYERGEVTQTLTLGESNILSWGFSAEMGDTYKSATVTYRDPKQKKAGQAGGYMTDTEKEEWIKNKKTNAAVMSYTFTDEHAEESAQELVVKKRAKSIEEAKLLAKAALREANARKLTGSMSLIGDVTLVSGAVVMCKGFGTGFDGKYIITKAGHSVGSGGYTTSIELRAVNENY